ncbi:MAG: tyrosine-type recombinase/integrase [Trebonia sp.]
MSSASFRKVTAAAGLNPADWTPREPRHSFVSLLSDAGVPVEKIARLVGHIGTTTTETVYRHQIWPVVTGGAEVRPALAGGPRPDHPCRVNERHPLMGQNDT